MRSDYFALEHQNTIGTIRSRANDALSLQANISSNPHDAKSFSICVSASLFSACKIVCLLFNVDIQGKSSFSSHTVDERILDELITKELIQTKKMYEENFQAMEQLIDQWQPKASAATAQIKKQQERITLLEEEMEAILMERIRDKANAERYDRMIRKREAEIAAAQNQIEELQNIEETLRNRQSKLKRDISMMDDILKEGHLTEAHLRLLVDKIYVHEENGKLSLTICLKAPFRDHLDIYENGERTDSYLSQNYDFERLGHIIMSDFWENGGEE